MSNAIVTVDGFTDEQVSLIKRTVAEGATNDELQMFLHQCRRMGLDPLAKQLIFQKYKTKHGPKVTFITTIDALRIIADRSGAYAGNDEPVFTGPENGYPQRASVTVWKIVHGARVPFSASVYWDEYCPEPPRDHNWRKMPHVMLGKCAEASALRKAFPNDMSGAYIREEMDQAGNDVIDVTPRNPQTEPEPKHENGKQNGAAPQDWKEGALEWMEKEGIAENYFNAQAIWKLCQLDEVETKGEAVKRVKAYREARLAGMTTDAAAEVAIYGAVQEAE